MTALATAEGEAGRPGPRSRRKARAGAEPAARTPGRTASRPPRPAELAKEMQTLRNRQGELLTRAKAEERESDRTAAALKTATTGLESRLLPASMEARAEDLQAKLKASTEAEKALRGEAAGRPRSRSRRSWPASPRSTPRKS